MSHTENILGMLSDRAGTGRDSQIYTPIPIAKDMVNILPEEVWNKDTTFLDPCCKSGVFLHEIYLKLMETSSMVQEFPDQVERRKHILQNQLYGISPNGMCQLMSTRTVYGTIQGENNIISFENNYLAVMQNTDKTFLYERLKKEFNTMKFDVVIGNPPYNKGMDLDFVDLGYKISNKYTVMITPAKWQTAEANQKVSSKNINYGQFRQMYVPHMSYVCFYPDCLDVFGISQADGISYFMIDKNSTYENNCIVQNKCNLQQCVNSTVVRDITRQQSLWNIGNEIVEYLGKYDKYRLTKVYERKNNTVNINKQLRQSLSGAWDWENSCIKKEYIGCGGYIFSQKGHNIGVIDKIRCLSKNEESTSSTSMDVFTSDNIDECKSFYTWINSKFTRFFILINISSLTILNDNTFRFVPAPPSGKFDHIYTDEELYKAFNLPQKYIDVIESVIKERK